MVPDRSGRPYLRTSQRVWSYAEVAQAADAAGAGLLGLGLERGDRVILSTRDRPEFVATFWGHQGRGRPRAGGSVIMCGGAPALTAA